jgi:myo-inositol 2-dehydrogenase / D-chiro-inositol 1-dehydrogenase
MFRFCLFGAGRIGTIHASNLSRHPGAKLDYVVDAQQSAAERVATAHGARTSDRDTALADKSVTAVIIASPTDTHDELIGACVAAGKAIFCEKPLDLDVNRARASMSKAQVAGVPLYLGFNRRYDPSFRKLRDAVAAGTIGTIEVLSIVSRDPAPPPLAYLRSSGGLFRDMMIHDFDMARFLLGEEPTELYAAGACLVDPAIADAGDVDTAVVVMRTAGGAFCQISNSRRCTYGYDQRIEIFGSTATVRADNQTATRVELASGSGVTREPALPFFLERYADAYRLELDDFIRALSGESVSLATAQDGLRALLLADAAESSMRSGHPVALSG